MNRNEMMKRFEQVRDDVTYWANLINDVENTKYLVGQAKIEKARIPFWQKNWTASKKKCDRLLKLKEELNIKEQQCQLLENKIADILCFIPRQYLNPEAVMSMHERLCYESDVNSFDLIDMHREELVGRQDEMRRKALREEQDREAYIEAEYDAACARYYNYY